MGVASTLDTTPTQIPPPRFVRTPPLDRWAPTDTLPTLAEPRGYAPVMYVLLDSVQCAGIVHILELLHNLWHIGGEINRARVPRHGTYAHRSRGRQHSRRAREWAAAASTGLL